MKVVGDYAWERSVNHGWVAPTQDIDLFQRRRCGLLAEWAKGSRSREVQSMDRVIVPSDYLRRMVMGWGASRVQVIYNALEADTHAPALTRAQARDQVGWSQAAHYLVTAARLTAWKGVDFLIDALVHLPDIRLAVAGDGPQFEALRARAIDKQVADRVEFLGKIAHERLVVYLRAADYLALYSGYEGLSHTILEALHTGTPVIASNRGGNPEIVRDGENGLLVQHPDLDALIAALRHAFTDDTPQRLAAGTAQGLDRFSWPCLIEQTIKTLVEVARATQ
jgi:teichuronic acid biosynthesis glycosyltransferase TuaC